MTRLRDRTIALSLVVCACLLVAPRLASARGNLDTIDLWILAWPDSTRAFLVDPMLRPERIAAPKAGQHATQARTPKSLEWIIQRVGRPLTAAECEILRDAVADSNSWSSAQWLCLSEPRFGVRIFRGRHTLDMLLESGCFGWHFERDGDKATRVYGSFARCNERLMRLWESAFPGDPKRSTGR